MTRKGLVPTTLLALVFGLPYLWALLLFGSTGFRDVAFALGLALPLVWLSLVDLERREIPDGASMLVAGTGVLLWSGDPDLLVFNLLISGALGLTLWAVGELVWRKSGSEVLGMGDAKLIAAGALVVGAEAFWMMLLLASIGGLVAALFTRHKVTTGVPFGPFLAYAIFVTSLSAAPPP